MVYNRRLQLHLPTILGRHLSFLRNIFFYKNRCGLHHSFAFTSSNQSKRKAQFE